MKSFLILSTAVLILAPAGAQAATLYNSTTTQSTVVTPAVAPAPIITTAATATTATASPGIAQSAAAATAVTPAQAVTPLITGAAPSSQALALGKQAGAACPGKWETPACLSVISNSNMAMASNYGADLQKKNMNADAELIKQHCAASTAASKDVVPAYAMKSAFIECANQIADTTAKTGVQPDLSQYQLLVGATICLDNDLRCAGIADQLKALAAR